MGQSQAPSDAHGLQQQLQSQVAQDLFAQSIARAGHPDFGLGQLIETAGALMAAGRGDFAVQLYRVWVSANPEHPQRYVAWFNCAVISSNRGDLDAARRELTEAITANPDFTAAYVNLGGVLERQGML